MLLNVINSLIGLVLALLASAPPGPGDDDLLHLIVLHTNDLHGQVLPTTEAGPNGVRGSVGGLPRVAAYIESMRWEAAEQGAELLVVDSGDWFQGTPEGSYEDGRLFVLALAAIGYDALCIGNHEFDRGVATLTQHLTAARLPAVLANARGDLGEPVPGCSPYKLVERAGLRIAIVGLVAVETPEITDASARAFVFEFPGRTLARLKREWAAKEVDWILPITHLGLEADRELARAHPDLDLIVGGHSHTSLSEGETVGNTLITQAGSRGRFVGRVDLWFDRTTKRVVSKQARLVRLDALPADEDRVPEVESICERLVAVNAERMAEPIGRLARDLERATERLRSSAAGNCVTDIMRAAAGADVALQNRGGLRTTLPAGVVTRRGVFELLPFGNQLTVLAMSGGELEACLRRAVENTAHRGLELSGAELVVHAGGDGFVLHEVLVAGEPLDRERVYRVATNSFLASGGDGYVELAGVRDRQVAKELVREVVERHFLERDVVTPLLENRYRVTTP